MPGVQLAQENQGLTIQANGDMQSGIQPFSGANYIAMSTGAIADQRAGQVIRNLNGQNIVFGSGATASRPPRPHRRPQRSRAGGQRQARRLDARLPGRALRVQRGRRHVGQLHERIRYVGFDNVNNGATSPLCSGGKAAIVTQFGFGTARQDGRAPQPAGLDLPSVHPVTV